jgi:hypothetical protein
MLIGIFLLYMNPSSHYANGMPTQYSINAPFLSKGTNHIESVVNVYSNQTKNKSDALVGRESTFHILQTSELAIFPDIHRKYPKFQNLRIIL